MLRPWPLAVLALAAGLARANEAPFVCDGGKQLPASYVNDDYCDCADGSDEPRTGACPGSTLRCENKMHKPTVVFASRVNDGVCDCCDGGDEPASPGLCKNTCVDRAREAFAHLEAACATKAERSRTGRAAATKRAEDLKKAAKELEEKQPEHARLRQLLDVAEADEAAELKSREARLASGELASALRLADLTDEMVPRALVRVALGAGVDGVDRMYETLLEHEQLKPVMDDVDSADLIEIAMAARDEQAAAKQAGQSAAPSEASETAAAQICEAHEVCGHEASMLAVLPLAELDAPSMRDVLGTFAYENDHMAALAKACRELLAGVGIAVDEKAVKGALELLEPFKHTGAEAARRMHSHVDVAINASTKVVNELTPIHELMSDFGEGQEWFHLHGKCFSHTVAQSLGGYGYEVCPFDKAEQNGKYSLGRYEGWAPLSAGAAEALARSGREPYAGGAMRFGGGLPCDEKPRSMRVLFECGEEDRLTEVTEPSTCEYEGWFETPSACSVDTLRRRYEDLEREAKRAGVPFDAMPEGLRKLLEGE